MTKGEMLAALFDVEIKHIYDDLNVIVVIFDGKTKIYDLDWWNAEYKEPCKDMGEVSDGYHTFNQLYYQRAVLFATIVNSNKDKAWKSLKHFDGNYCFDSNGEWFIVGVDTPKGSYTYHYSKEYWDMFNCEELEHGKEWDGHTEEDVTRLLSLAQEPILDKIRAEINELYSYVEYDEDIKTSFNMVRLEEVQSVIDKYKAESECMFSDYPDMPYQFDNMTGSMNL